MNIGQSSFYIDRNLSDRVYDVTMKRAEKRRGETLLRRVGWPVWHSLLGSVHITLGSSSFSLRVSWSPFLLLMSSLVELHQDMTLGLILHPMHAIPPQKAPVAYALQDMLLVLLAFTFILWNGDSDYL